MTGEQWWVRLRFVEGGWEIVGQTQDQDVANRWDDEIDAREDANGIDHEFIVWMPYGARPADPTWGGKRKRDIDELRDE